MAAPKLIYLDDFTVKGLGTKINFSRQSAESPLRAEFSNGTVRNFFPIHRGHQELYSFSSLSFTRWLEVGVYGWNTFEVGLLEVKRNSMGVVTGVKLQCESLNGPFWFPKKSRR